MPGMRSRKAVPGIFRQPGTLSELRVLLHARVGVLSAARRDWLRWNGPRCSRLVAGAAVCLRNRVRHPHAEYHDRGGCGLRHLVCALLQSDLAGNRSNAESTVGGRFRIERKKMTDQSFSGPEVPSLIENSLRR